MLHRSTTKLTLVTFGSQEPLRGFETMSMDIKVEPPEPTSLDGGCILQVKDDETAAAAYLQRIRATPSISLLPVLLAGAPSRELAERADAVVGNAHEARELADRIWQAIAELPEGRDMDEEYGLLAYLYTRKTALTPIKAPCSPLFYTYPLAALFLKPEEDPNELLLQLQHRSLLMPVRLFDRVRLCPECGKAQINYVDVCPTCASIDIVKHPFLHCFTCGNVAPQESFISASGLQCPNCRARLRHIGTDYDRALESYQCNACGLSFIEPDVVARCMACELTSKPESLDVRAIPVLALSDKGRTAVRTGGVEDVYALLDRLNYTHPKMFEEHINWMLRMLKRYPDAPFSLIGIRLCNVPEIVDRLGRQQTYQLLETFAERLRQLVRSTDIATRTALETIWLLLPRTDTEGCDTLHSRILALGEATVRTDGMRLDFDTVSHTESGTRSDGDDATLLLAQLSSRMGEEHQRA